MISFLAHFHGYVITILGLSLKAQELYLAVFLLRYLDLFYYFYSMYNSLIKIINILTTASIIWTLKVSESARSSYSPAHDSIHHWTRIFLPCCFLGFAVHLYGVGVKHFYAMEMCWQISICLEAVAMLPQLIIFKSTDRFVKGNKGDAKDEILLPIFLLGIYRVFFILSWIYRAHTEFGYKHHFFVYICGCVQVLLYSQFFYKFLNFTLCPRNDSEQAADLESPLLGDEEAVGEDQELTSLRLDENAEDSQE